MRMSGLASLDVPIPLPAGGGGSGCLYTAPLPPTITCTIAFHTFPNILQRYSAVGGSLSIATTLRVRRDVPFPNGFPIPVPVPVPELARNGEGGDGRVGCLSLNNSPLA